MMAMHIRSMWGPENGIRPHPNAANEACFAELHVQVTVDLEVPPEPAWALLTDPTRIGEFSPECVAARWIEESDQAVVGSRFEGTNQMVLADGQVFEWVRPCAVTRCEPPLFYEYVAHDRWDQPATEWKFEIEPTSNGCRLTQSMRALPGGLSGIRLAADADPSSARALLDHRIPQLRRGMVETLQRVKVRLER
jgi:uncharacterized protein YndB with AHSA1/START domain